MGLDEPNRFRQFFVASRVAGGQVKIFRNANQSCDGAVLVFDRDLGGDTPAGFAVNIQVQFEQILDLFSFSQHLPILLEVTVTEG